VPQGSDAAALPEGDRHAPVMCGPYEKTEDPA
jgi:hypothetical protein